MCNVDLYQSTGGEPHDATWDFHFSTEGLAAHEKFDAWSDASHRLFGVEASTDTPAAFSGEFRGRTAGPVTLVRSRSTLSRYERTSALADSGDQLSLSFLGGDHSVAEPDTGDSSFAMGDGLFLAHDRPFSLTQRQSVDTSYHLVLERQSLVDLLPSGTELSFRRFGAGTAALSLIKGYIPALTSASEASSPEAREMMGRHIVDLIALLLRPSAAVDPVIDERPLKAARVKAILDLIARHHAVPELSADWVGARLGISARQIHRLLEETPKTFHEHILESRLNRAHALLSDPEGPALSVAEVARRAGFTGLSHFSRSFNTRFGATPSAVRAATAREASSRLCTQDLAA